MSQKTWLDEFYLVPARAFAGKRKTKRNKLAALDHSILKWMGLRAEPLARHQVELGGYCILGASQNFEINGGTCALCQLVGKIGDEVEWTYCCRLCPLCIVRGNVKCDDERPREKNSPYHKMFHGDCPGPGRMLYWLRRARRMVEDA